jgi:hypothetical protein
VLRGVVGERWLGVRHEVAAMMSTPKVSLSDLVEERNEELHT